MSDDLDVLRDPGGATEPDPEFHAALMRQVRTALAATDAATHLDRPEPAAEQPTDGHESRPWPARTVAVLLVVLVLSGLTWLAGKRSAEAPAEVPTTVRSTVGSTVPGASAVFPERAFDPLSGTVEALSAGADGPEWQPFSFAVTEHGVRVSDTEGFAPAEVPADVLRPPSGPVPAITDHAWAGGGTYSITCCTDGHGTLWRNGEEVASATSVDYDLVHDGGLAHLDATTGTVVIGDVTFEEPGALDLTVLSHEWAAALVGGDEPRLVVYYAAAGFEGGTPERTEYPLPASAEGACAAVGLDTDVVLLVGQPVDDDRCVGDRVVAVSIDDGREVEHIDFPEPVRSINSDHATLIVGTSTDGSVWVGTIRGDTAENPWYLLTDGDYRVATIEGT
jgi:hypothetical protein